MDAVNKIQQLLGFLQTIEGFLEKKIDIGFHGYVLETSYWIRSVNSNDFIFQFLSGDKIEIFSEDNSLVERTLFYQKDSINSLLSGATKEEFDRWLNEGRRVRVHRKRI